MDNTVGSLTQFQKSVILGSLLGDGYTRILPGRTNAFLEINHGYNAKEYVDWKFQVLKNICISEPKMRKGNGKRIAYRFFTKQHPEITELHAQFYRDRLKVVPESLQLDSVILSIWFMDDGSRCRDRDVYLNTQQFRKEDQEVLLEKLKGLGLQASLNRDKEYYRIRFLSDSVRRLNDLIRNYVIPSMRYKLSYNPVETCEYQEDIPYAGVKPV